MIRVAAMLCALTFGSNAALAQSPQPSQIPNTVFNLPIPNIPGKNLLATVVHYEPGGRTGPHHHSPSAFIAAYVLKGAVRSQVDDQPVRVYRAGEYFTENPGAHHLVSENASKTEPAELLAIFVLDSSEATLTKMDK